MTAPITEADREKAPEEFKDWYEARYGQYPGIPGESWDRISLRLAEAFVAYMSEMITAALAQARAEEREACAQIVTEGYQGLSKEHRVLLLARATAIRARGQTHG